MPEQHLTTAKASSIWQRLRNGWPWLVLIVVLVVTCVLVTMTASGGWNNAVDQRIYHGAISWWLDGNNLYSYAHPPEGRWGFTYPPVAALLMLPMALVTVEQAIVVVSTAIVVTAVLTTCWLVIPIADRHGLPRWAVIGAAMPIMAMLGPLRENLGFGQVSLFLAALVLVDVVGLMKGRRWAGIGIGLATAIKLTPGFFIIYLLATRQWRAAITASSVAAAATLCGLAAGPPLWWDFWSNVLWNTNRVGSMGSSRNQSLAGLLTRLQNTDFSSAQSRPHLAIWVVTGTLVVVIGLWRAYRAHRDGDELAAITIAGLACVLISPISWAHHMYWVVPAIALITDVALGSHGRRRMALLGAGIVATAVFSSGIIHLYWHPGGHHYDDGLLGVLTGNAYVAACLGLLFITPWRPINASIRTDIPTRARKAAATS